MRLWNEASWNKVGVEAHPFFCFDCAVCGGVSPLANLELLVGGAVTARAVAGYFTNAAGKHPPSLLRFPLRSVHPQVLLCLHVLVPLPTVCCWQPAQPWPQSAQRFDTCHAHAVP